MKILNSMFCMVLISSILFIRCDKGEAPPISQIDMWNCYNKITWDTGKIGNNLIGVWEWEFEGCYWNPKDANGSKNKGLTIEFKIDYQVEIKLNGQIINTSKWYVGKADLHLFALKLDPVVEILKGRVLFCGDKLQFNDSYQQGCDNYFKKKK